MRQKELAKNLARSLNIRGKVPQPSKGLYNSQEITTPMVKLTKQIFNARFQPHRQMTQSMLVGNQIKAVNLT